MSHTQLNSLTFAICFFTVVRARSAGIVLQVHSAVEEMDGLDDVENSMLYYNQAVILYHLRQYTEAISVGEKLYQFIEPFGMLSVEPEISSLSCKFLYCFYLDDLNLSYTAAFKGEKEWEGYITQWSAYPVSEGLNSMPHENSWGGTHRWMC